MRKYAILMGYFTKQLSLFERLYQEVTQVDLSVYENRYLFALKTQQLYTALEDLFKQIAKAFENHLDSLISYHKELLLRMHTEVPKIRPAVLTDDSLKLLDKVRAFRYFVRHAYDCELEENQLQEIQDRLLEEFSSVDSDVRAFGDYVKELTDP